ncbi:DNA-dependent metalloprotease dvc-1 [Colletes gigas]|uniref:DNA-dependent metalloprotease dvc-1 n=1 Tax=Colletes gigas TaxID=935657 RepID=UPI001C9BA884|nr:DNA-dependent metalloprotease dvc-1 [Colletes gigas]
MMKSQESCDFELARKLYQQDQCFGLTENAILPKKNDEENYKPRTLIDQTLELIDPTPNIYTLFVQFNERFFWNVLLPVEVKWSRRMTSCAGVCSFHPRNRQCIISLSEPLLKLRPRKDLVETLLHEMIHGYLFITNNNRDRDGHGPEFCKHMDRINKTAGTKITIYHSFHDEVKLYKQHWWRCNGPCQKRAPYFGTVRRAMNRAPGPNDFWWKEHQQNCGGQFIKIKEPENFKVKNSKNKEKTKPAPKSKNSTNNMLNWFTKSNSSTATSSPTSTLKNIKSFSNTSNSLNGFKKLGNNTNNVYGWGIGGPSTLNNSQKSSNSISDKPKFSSSEILGGSNTGRSNLLSKFDTSKWHPKSNIDIKESKKAIDTFITAKTKEPTINNNNQPSNTVKLAECPICSNLVPNDDINKHIDSCLKITDDVNSAKSQIKIDNTSTMLKRKIDTITFPNKQQKLENSENLRITNCPVCDESFELKDINAHLDKCLLDSSKQNDSTIKLDDRNDANETKDDSIISISSSSGNSSSTSITEDLKDLCPNLVSEENNASHTSQKCLVCNISIPPEMSLNDHLEDCIGNLFNDESVLSTNCNDAKIVSIDQHNKYPCPVCMQLISESFMNQHLDVCLKDT